LLFLSKIVLAGIVINGLNAGISCFAKPRGNWLDEEMALPPAGRWEARRFARREREEKPDPEDRAGLVRLHLRF